MPERHESSCSVYNAPAYEPGPCDCRFRRRNMVRSLKLRHWLAFSAGPLLLATVPAVFFIGWTAALIFPSLGIIAISFAALMTPEPKHDEALDKAVEACMISDQ